MGIKESLTEIGNAVSGLTRKVLDLIPSELLASETTSQVVSIMVSVGIIFIVLKFAGSLSKIMKWALIVLFGLLIISVLTTLFGI